MSIQANTYKVEPKKTTIMASKCMDLKLWFSRSKEPSQFFTSKKVSTYKVSRAPQMFAPKMIIANQLPEIHLRCDLRIELGHLW